MTAGVFPGPSPAARGIAFRDTPPKIRELSRLDRSLKIVTDNASRTPPRKPLRAQEPGTRRQAP
jgi:3-methyladenine DNA glycosylase/8-oxoguanine DNA glycosylase